MQVTKFKKQSQVFFDLLSERYDFEAELLGESL